MPISNTSPPVSTYRVMERWPLIDLKLAIMFLRSLYRTGLTPNEALDELARLQPTRAAFWQSAARHTKSGKPLHDYFKGRWPESLVTPIRIAETSGRIQDVFLGMEKALQQQIDARKLLSKLYYPLVVVLGGIGAAIFFVAGVIPQFFDKIRFNGPLPFIVTFSRAAQALITNYGFHILIALSAVILLGIWKWREDEDFRTAIFALINRVPVVGWSSRWIWFAVWANYVSIMIKADIPFTEIFRITSSTLPPHLQTTVTHVISQLERGQSLTKAATPSNSIDDPLHLFPVHITNAFRMTDRSGQGAEQFAIASETLFVPGEVVLSRAITTITNLFYAFSGALLIIPASMYLQTIITLTRTIGGPR